MKKILLIVAFITSCCMFAQTDLIIQNYTAYQVEFSMFKSDQTNVSGGCAPTWEGKSTPTGLSILQQSPSPAFASTDAYYFADLNQSNTFNPAYPYTPSIDTWIENSNYASPYVLPGSIIPASSLAASFVGMKFGIRDPASGIAVGGYYPFGYLTCGAAPITSLAPYTSLISGTFFSFGGADWVVFF